MALLTYIDNRVVVTGLLMCALSPSFCLVAVFMLGEVLAVVGLFKIALSLVVLLVYIDDGAVVTGLLMIALPPFLLV